MSAAVADSFLLGCERTGQAWKESSAISGSGMTHPVIRRLEPLRGPELTNPVMTSKANHAHDFTVTANQRQACQQIWRTLRLGVSVPFSQDEDAHVYTKEDFERHQRTDWSGTEEAHADRLKRCRDTLELLFRAAARGDGDPPHQRLPGVMDSFMQWCESARDDFKLGSAIDEQLAQRRFRTGMTQEYRDWRAMARGNPEGLKAAGFEDDPSQGDKEELRLEQLLRANSDSNSQTTNRFARRLRRRLGPQFGVDSSDKVGKFCLSNADALSNHGWPPCQCASRIREALEPLGVQKNLALMDTHTLAWYGKDFEIAFRKAKDDVFQTLFERLMNLAYKADFMACRPWGNVGDKKNDGFLKSERRLFQVYAPNETRFSTNC